MDQIYENNLWGGEEVDFYSGIGSHHPDSVLPYIDAVSTFLKSLPEPVTVCDLGCGDFNVGKQLVECTSTFIGVDIVEALILRNQQMYPLNNVVFQCLDIAEDPLPKADVAILRQVLQHLSNAEIKKIVSKLNNYSFVIITEHVPEGNFIPNKDIISGQGIRLKKQSGVQLLDPPFNLKVVDETLLCVVRLRDHPGVLVTKLYQMN
ncbi:class I SAM-dependent methyltransferase [Aquimarina brevivitae]|uniref:class I SAM-dependent methyltransferase n=1 Tax=Aquimarina brevivitae TaxID=323412 RepID=UPI0010296A58|nr:class I SAM-dependent methyltransferase [Aquimarina brevivitae]